MTFLPPTPLTLRWHGAGACMPPISQCFLVGLGSRCPRWQLACLPHFSTLRPLCPGITPQETACGGILDSGPAAGGTQTNHPPSPSSPALYSVIEMLILLLSQSYFSAFGMTSPGPICLGLRGSPGPGTCNAKAKNILGRLGDVPLPAHRLPAHSHLLLVSRQLEWL